MLPEQLEFVGRKRYSFVYRSSRTFIVLSSSKMGRNFIKKIRLSSEGGSRDIKGWGKPSIVNNNKKHSYNHSVNPIFDILQEPSWVLLNFPAMVQLATS